MVSSAGEFQFVSALSEQLDRVDGLSEVVGGVAIDDQVFLSSERDHCLTVLRFDGKEKLTLLECIARDRQSPVPGNSRKLPFTDVSQVAGGNLCGTPDSRYLLVPSDGSMIVFQRNGEGTLSLISTYGMPGTVQGKLPGFLWCAITPSQKHALVSRVGDGAIEMLAFDSNSGSFRRTQFVEGVGRCMQLTLTQDGKHLYALSHTNGVLYTYAVDEKLSKLTKTNELHPRDIGVVSFMLVTSLCGSPDSTLMAMGVAGDDGAVVILKRDVSNGHLVRIAALTKTGSGITDLAAPRCLTFSPDGEFLFAGCAGGKVVALARGPDGNFVARATISHPTVHDPTFLIVAKAFLFVCSHEPGTVSVFRISKEKKPDGNP
jgi:WD40 repeat protein